jgi:hypothetical protein
MWCIRLSYNEAQAPDGEENPRLALATSQRREAIMSTLTYSGSHMPAAETTGASANTERRGFWRRVADRVVAAQQRRAERAIAAYLQSHGGLLTDDMEREISERMAGGRRRSV